MLTDDDKNKIIAKFIAHKLADFRLSPAGYYYIYYNNETYALCDKDREITRIGTGMGKLPELVIKL